MAENGNVRYLRYILLLGEGALLVLRGVVRREVQRTGFTLDAILTIPSNRRHLKRNFDSKTQCLHLFPCNSTVNSDIETWDISLLTIVIQRLLWSNISRDERVQISYLQHCTNEYQIHPRAMSMDETDYTTRSADLATTLQDLASGLDQQTRDTLTRIINDSNAVQFDFHTPIQNSQQLYESKVDMLPEIEIKFHYVNTKLDTIQDESTDQKQMTRDMGALKTHIHDGLLDMKSLAEENYRMAASSSKTMDVFEDTQHLAQRPIQATQEVDGRHAPEEVMECVEEQDNNDVQTSVDGHQTSEPSLSDRLNSKSYRPPKDACIFDGRLIKLGLKDIADLEKNCIKPIGDGAFGKVFTSNSVSDGFGMHVAVKKIPFDNPDAHSRSIRREMIMSRIMHPFILPLLAVVDLTNRKPKPEFWFVSPFCKKGDLQKAIEKDHIGQDTIRMNEKKRIRILLHIALAIQYIHTKVPDVRDIILHKDISSKNVVLDNAYNARLIDFGLAREKDDQTTDARGRMCYSPPDIGRRNPATESWDYYMFAVIIREILTGLGPQGINNKFLKNMEAKEVLQKLEKRVWIKTDRARYLNDIAEQCLQQNARTVSEFNTTVVEKINDIWKKYFVGSKIHQVPNNYAKCHICMINPKARETSMTQKHAANCRQKIEVCIACEKNSSLNPITCYCGTKLTPLIGNRCGALLVAGNDTNNKSMAKALAKDIEELKKLITSQAPRVMGISEDKVCTVIPSIPDKPDNPKLEDEQKLWPKVKEHIRYFSRETEIDTLLIYFSCHGASNMGTGDAKNHNVFRFGSASDNITLGQFEDELESLENIDKLIIFLDRCFPPLLRFKKRDRKFIQINACKQDEMADITDSGSVFTKYLIQGLKANSKRKKCYDSNCQHCDAYWSNSSGSDFISVSSLFDYVKKHMEAIKGPLPVPIMQIDFPNIAFYTDEEVIIEFKCDEEQKRVPLEYLQNIEQLQDTLYEVFKRDKSTTRVRIQRDTYRKNDRFVNCETLKNVMSAWVRRQPLTVTFETTLS